MILYLMPFNFKIFVDVLHCSHIAPQNYQYPIYISLHYQRRATLIVQNILFVYLDHLGTPAMNGFGRYTAVIVLVGLMSFLFG